MPDGIHAAKVSSTPDDLVRGVSAAIGKVLTQSGRAPSPRTRSGRARGPESDSS
jgi:hypothetical protein